MFCGSCGNQTNAAFLFCHVCDTYSPNGNAGTKANVGLRLFAHILDGVFGLLIFGVISAVSCAMIGVGGIGVSPRANDAQNMAAAGMGATLGFGTFLLAFVSYIVFVLFFLAKGKTPGKAMLGLRVADKRNGGIPGIGRMLLREIIGKFVSGLAIGLGYVWAIFDPDAQAWHDKIAGTVVLKSRVPSAQKVLAS